VAAEYALILAIGALAVIAGVLFLGGEVDQLLRGAASRPGVLEPPPAVCEPGYGGACVPTFPPDLDCDDLRDRGIPLPLPVDGEDPHGLDPDGDGLGC
jgi:hypothetical protein